MEQKGMTFDHDFGYYFPLFSSLLKKREEEKENELEKIVNKGHAFLLDLWLMIKNHGKKKERQMIVITIEKIIKKRSKEKKSNKFKT